MNQTFFFYQTKIDFNHFAYDLYIQINHKTLIISNSPKYEDKQN